MHTHTQTCLHSFTFDLLGFLGLSSTSSFILGHDTTIILGRVELGLDIFQTSIGCLKCNAQ